MPLHRPAGLVQRRGISDNNLATLTHSSVSYLDLARASVTPSDKTVDRNNGTVARSSRKGVEQISLLERHAESIGREKRAVQQVAELGAPTTLHIEDVGASTSTSPHSSAYSPLPAKEWKASGHDRCRGYRRRLFTAYKVIFTLVVLINVISLAALQALDQLIADHILTAVSANLFVSIFIRQEELLNIFYELCTRTPPTTPLLIRKHLADFHHYGGMHSGCALSSIIWYIRYLISTTRAIHPIGSATTLQIVDLAASYTLLLILLFIALTAFPHLRRTRHNLFEKSHRFGGWTALLVLWTHSILSSIADTNPDHAFLFHPSFYLLTLTTFLVILPWLRIRHIPVTATRLSDKEVTLTFPYWKMPSCSTIRFSTAPLLEWHAFATIPSPTSHDTASIIVSAAGDWTTTLTADPPKRIWYRGPPTHNFLLGARMFESVLIVATGAGIGPCVSYLQGLSLHERCSRTTKILWSARDPVGSFGQGVLDLIMTVDPGAVIIDSNSGTGRPDLSALVRGMVASQGLEAVFVVSNKWVTDVVVGDCGVEGVPAFGAVFDS
ncbi:hypothetical protein BDV96DRAFT_600782 [Lophiotrema nucula]|uniref:FAD-binding FR-type domain-containing protein n=1 Tax=Lophiotrema nucula TaxID=690887 RepID=A0A6A5Z3P8_9PLEO|nr:hypothetical protein BDV96DRAFT_600782 [Lophiotrema nucula]